MNRNLLAPGGHDDLFHQQLQAVGDRLQEAQRTDAIGAYAHLDPADQLALPQGQVSNAQEQRHHDADDQEQRLDRVQHVGCEILAGHGDDDGTQQPPGPGAEIHQRLQHCAHTRDLLLRRHALHRDRAKHGAESSGQRMRGRDPQAICRQLVVAHRRQYRAARWPG